MSVPSRRYDRRHGAKSGASLKRVDDLAARAREALASGDAGKAMSLCERALAVDPRNSSVLCAYATAATLMGRPDAGMEAARIAVKLQPFDSDAHHCLGAALRHLGQPRPAIDCLGRALDLRPNRPDSLLELCMAFLDVGDAAAAEPFLNAALDSTPNTAVAQTTLGRYYASAGRLDDAMAALRRAVALDERHTEAHSRLGSLLRDAGDIDAAIGEFEQAVAQAPDRADHWSNLLLTLQCSSRDAADIATAHRGFGHHFRTRIQPMPSMRVADDSDRRLKIGYLSSNFRRHAVAKFFEPLLECHDRSRFDVHCYYNFPVDDELTASIRARAEHFANVCGMRDGFVASAIRRDGIDILVDLDGHTAPNRLPVFFLRPAPIQVTWLGYLATTGVPAVDYRLTDGWADPPGATEHLHAESLWRLPSTAWCYRPYDEAPDCGAPAFEANGWLTFVSLNNPGKVSAGILELWASILRQVDASRLVLHVSLQASRVAGVEHFFADRGIPPERLELVGRSPIDQYFAHYRNADIALDTWPCAGGTTTCDALWMGLPVVTLTGRSSFSRTGASILASVGLDGLITATPQDYVKAAVDLARDRARVARLRGSLRAAMRGGRLTDGPAFARNVEAAYGAMWRDLRGPTRVA
jgi:predicted O-linked N-acetylglucosamine transferase (SPINDLY family)